ncbi:MAG: polysaccharide deacetylase family protein [Candidatus Rifleibacteriota bacterium]
MIKSTIKQIFKVDFPFLNPLNRFYKFFLQNQACAIFVLHRVEAYDPERLPENEGMKVSPCYLENIIHEYKKQKIRFVSLEELHTELLSDSGVKEPSVAFTLDDGYEDNYRVAFPLFTREKVPFTVFLTTDFPERKAVLWWYALEEILLKHDKIDFLNFSLCTETKRQKSQAFNILRRHILSLPEIDLKTFLEKVFEKFDVDVGFFVEKMALSWDQIKEMALSPLCSFGGHSISHRALNSLNQSDLIREIKDGNRLIEERIGKKIDFFAFPFGTENEFGPREVDLALETGIKAVFRADGGCVKKNMDSSKNALPRVWLKGF